MDMINGGAGGSWVRCKGLRTSARVVPINREVHPRESKTGNASLSLQAIEGAEDA